MSNSNTKAIPCHIYKPILKNNYFDCKLINQYKIVMNNQYSPKIPNIGSIAIFDVLYTPNSAENIASNMLNPHNIITVK